ncbi:unnamed protein product [Allacma fusca]|uniref:Uncharacterized protein n=1 Tax=Allacma fusca TaxID=39272 RepID=A0A8J2LM75_9HEXA|nr:unnamed protein product [Allacma fusca]
MVGSFGSCKSGRRNPFLGPEAIQKNSRRFLTLRIETLQEFQGILVVVTLKSVDILWGLLVSSNLLK